MKYIINNISKSDDFRALHFVRWVIEGGLISDYGTCYCSVTTYRDKETDEVTRVSCTRNKSGSFRFNVWNIPE
jgi:hypothetical protein